MTGLAQSYVSQGWEQGWIQGSKDTTIEIASRMIGKHWCVNEIMEYTNLDREVLEVLAAEMGEKLQEASQTSASGSQIEARR